MIFKVSSNFNRQLLHQMIQKFLKRKRDMHLILFIPPGTKLSTQDLINIRKVRAIIPHSHPYPKSKQSQTANGQKL
jgi:hypothetical protein